jgi:hypothetical protein
VDWPKVMDIRLYRYAHSDQGTFGVICFNGMHLFTGELPWRNNEPNYSCIPAGEYDVQVRDSPRFGRCYWVHPVSGRSYILFHSGNFCGDSRLGFRTNVQGCILLGHRRGALYGQRAVLASRTARTTFETELDFEPFRLKVIER